MARTEAAKGNGLKNKKTGKKQKYEISVVVCAKNEEKTLERCLMLLSRQKQRPEIIVVDGHSTDKTRNIARKYADNVITDNKQGISDARNVGWKNSSCDIVAYCDADCRPPKKWTETILHVFRAHPELLAISGPLESYDGNYGMKLSIMLWADWAPRIASAVRYNNLWGANMALRRSVLRKHPFKLRFLEDYYMGHTLRRVGISKLKFHKRMRMSMSSRRFEKGFAKTCLNYYVKTYVMMKLLRRYGHTGYY